MGRSFLALGVLCALAIFSPANAFHGSDSALKIGKTYASQDEEFIHCKSKEMMLAVLDASNPGAVFRTEAQKGNCAVSSGEITVLGLADGTKKFQGAEVFVVEVKRDDGTVVFMLSDIAVEQKPKQ